MMLLWFPVLRLNRVPVQSPVRLRAALAPFLGGAKSGSTGGNFANGGNGGNSGDATNKNSNNVGVGSFAGGRKLQNWGETSSQVHQRTSNLVCSHQESLQPVLYDFQYDPSICCCHAEPKC
jgi:hypothetical protein